jgi:hypothetical protein
MRASSGRAIRSLRPRTAGRAAGKGASVIDSSPTGMAEATLPHRQERLDQLPEFVV